MNCTSKLTLWAISVFIVFTSLSVAQPRPGEWKNYTSMKEVRDISVNGDSLWGSTSGGLFLYISSSGLYKRFTTSEGLLSNDLTAITIDPYNRIWTGTSSGYIVMFNPEQSSWFYVRSIAESDRTQKVIRKLYISGDTLYIATDFGISVYLLKRQEFGDSYTNFGFQMPTRVNDITILNGKIYAATASGLAVGTLGAQNLTGPSAWKRYTTNNGLPSNSLI